MSQTLKRYPISDSPFYKLRGIGQLATVIGVKLDAVPKIITRANYNVWVNEKGRDIQAPQGKLKLVHQRIAQLLSRVELPDYVYSRKGRSHIENAVQHARRVPLIKTDISRFYPSTSREMVIRMFRDQFSCAPDVANLLADICCFEQRHLPTGSALSGYAAFMAAKPLFDEIGALAESRSCRMSIFVDDITISGVGADRALLEEVRRMIRKAGLNTKSTKSRAYAANRPKPVTGTIVSADGLRLPNRQHRKLRDTRIDLMNAKPSERPALRARMKGQRIAALQVQMSEERFIELLCT